MQPRDNHGSTVLGDSVPRQVVENVDGYRNPHMYTKNALSRATGENQYALGRILGLEVSPPFWLWLCAPVSVGSEFMVEF